MTTNFDTSTFDPLSSSNILEAPAAWGEPLYPVGIVYADSDTQHWLDREAAIAEKDGRKVLREEFAALLKAAPFNERPSSVMHSLLDQGPMSACEIAGTIGAQVRIVDETITALGWIGVVSSTGETDSFGDIKLVLHPEVIPNLLVAS